MFRLAPNNSLLQFKALSHPLSAPPASPSTACLSAYLSTSSLLPSLFCRVLILGVAAAAITQSPAAPSPMLLAVLTANRAPSPFAAVHVDFLLLAPVVYPFNPSHPTLGTGEHKVHWSSL